MKIAYVLNTYPQPSHSFIRREIRALERRGVDVSRIAMRRPGDPLVDDQDRAEEARTDYVLEQGALALFMAVQVCLIRAPRRWLGALAMAWRVGARSQVGVLRHLVYFAEGCAVANRCAARGITHLHAHFGTNATTVAMLAHALGAPCYSFTVHGPEEFDAPRALSLGDKVHNAAFAIAISQFGRSQIYRWAAFEDWDKVHVVHCGIDPEAFPDPPPLSDGPRRLVAIGRFVEQKGHMLLVRAMAQVIAQAPQCHLTLIGEGAMRGAIEAAIADLGLGGNITLTGWVDEPRVRAEIGQAHGLVMPSFAEGLPMVVMEAMAAARPVISTAIAGTPELVQEGETGWLVPAGDTDALARAILSLDRTPTDSLTEMGRSGRARVLARHDVTIEAAKLARLFADASAPARPSDG